jgi:hypothetical protein
MNIQDLEKFYFLGYNAMWTTESQLTFWLNMSQGSRVCDTRSNHEAAKSCLLRDGVSCFAYSSSLTMVVISFPNTTHDFQWTIQHCVPENIILRN